MKETEKKIELIIIPTQKSLRPIKWSNFSQGNNGLAGDCKKENKSVTDFNKLVGTYHITQN